MAMNHHNYSAMLIVAGHVVYTCVFSLVTVNLVSDYNNLTACQEGFCGMIYNSHEFAAQTKQ